MDAARIVSLNLGMPREVEWQGRRFTTAIVKTPAGGPVALRGVNFAGDDQADRRVHGGPDKAVYAYAAEYYAWWEGELGTPLAPGTFGENLTTAGVDAERRDDRRALARRRRAARGRRPTGALLQARAGA